MTIQSDNLGFLIGKPIKLNGVDEKLDAIEKNTRELVSIFKNGQRIERRIVSAKPFVPKLSAKSIIDVASRPTSPANKPLVSTRQVKSDAVYQVKKPRKVIVKQNGEAFDLMPKAQAHIATLGARNNKGQFVSTQKPAVTPYGKSMAGVLTKQQEKQEFKEKRQWRLDLFNFMRKSNKDAQRERKKSDGLLSKIAGKAMGGVRTVTGGAARGLFGMGGAGGIADELSGGLGLLGAGGKMLKGLGKFFLKNPIGRVLALGGLALGANKAFASDGTEEDKQNVAKSAGGIAGGAAGWMGGAAAGAALGSFVPVIGTAVGGIVGGLIGAFAGDSAGEQVGEMLYKKDWKTSWDKVRNGMSWTFGGMTDSIKTLSGYAWDGMRSFWGTTWAGVGALFPDMTKNIESIFTSMSASIVSGANSAWDAVTTWAKGASDWTSKKWEEAKAGYNGEAMPANNNTPAPQALPDSLKGYANADLGSFKRKEVTVDAADLHGYGTHKEKQVRYVKKGQRIEGGGSTKDVELTESQYSQVKGYQEQVSKYNAASSAAPEQSMAYNVGSGVRSVLGKGKKISKEKQDSIARVAKNIGVEPNDLAAVISFETAGTFSEKIKNPNSSGSGLIQFMDKTAKGLGTTTSDLRSMSFDEQMNYVEKYFKNRGFNGQKKRSVADLYTAVTGSGYKRGSESYELNKVWDSNGDGYIAAGEMVQNKSFKAHQKDYFGTDSANTVIQGKTEIQPKVSEKRAVKTQVAMIKPPVIKSPVVNVKDVKYTTPEIPVASLNRKHTKLNTDQQNKSAQTTVLASQNVSDRMLAHVASGGIGFNNYV